MCRPSARCSSECFGPCRGGAFMSRFLTIHSQSASTTSLNSGRVGMSSGSGIAAADRLCRPGPGRGQAGIQPRHPADPGGELLRLPRARQRRAQGRPAARPARGGRRRPRRSCPGKPDESELIARIFADDADEVDAAAEVAQEADRGAEGHCSSAGSPQGPSISRTGRSSPPKRPALPAVKNEAWVRNPIDRFILAEAGEATGCSRRPRPTAARWPAGSAST